MEKHNLDRVNILLADNDVQIAKIIIASLHEMGFKRIHHVRNSTDAMVYISTQSVDILITEWLLEPMDGIELVKHLRMSKTSPNRGIPIVMLTGKGELVDVTTARDVGITEFLVKPFTVQNLYDRIVHLVDHPRSFVLAQNFVGPDRRRRAAPESESATSERRKARPKTIKKTAKELIDIESLPVIIAPDDEIKRIIGLGAPLSNLITPEVLAAAQKFLDSTHDENLQSVKNDLAELEGAFANIRKSAQNLAALELMQAAALAIKSRSGTFGFVIPSKVARLLYLFLSGSYDPSQTLHNNVVQQCIESIKVIFASNPKAQDGMAGELVQELEQLVLRVSK
jgi:DNA-binding response OmpR family regulator